MQLRGTTWDHPRGYDCVVAASEAYASKTGVRIEWERRSLQAFADAPIAAIAEHSDFIVLDHPHVGVVSQNGALLPLPFDSDPKASIGGSQESYVWNGACWAYALDAACQMTAYRSDLITDLPVTWEALYSSDASLFRPLTPLLPVDAFDTFLSIVAGRGEDRLPHRATQFVSRENGIYALDVLRRLYALGPDDQLEMNPINVLETLATGDEFACSPCLFGYVNYARSGFRPHRISYADLPVSKGFGRPRAILGGAGIGVSAMSSAPDAAIDFARWISSEPVQSGVYFANNGQPAHRESWVSLAEDPDVAGFFRGGFRTMENAWTRPRDPWFLGLVDEVCEIMPDLFRSSNSTEVFLEKINAVYRHHAKGL